MEVRDPDTAVAAFSVDLQRTIQPLIERAVAE
jgi:hypothetical protein